MLLVGIYLFFLLPIFGFPWATRLVGYICLCFLARAVLLVKTHIRPLEESESLSGIVDAEGLKQLE